MELTTILKQIDYPDFRIENETSFSNLSMLIPGYGTGDSLVFAAAPRFVKKLDKRVKMVLTTEEYADQIRDLGYGVCVVDDPRRVFYLIHSFLSGEEEYCRKSFPTVMGDNCSISSMTDISDMNVVIGNNVTIESFVSIKANTVIGDNTVIRSGASIGGPGYDYKDFGQGMMLTPQIGGIQIGDNVEINSNTCIECATFPYENTIIGEGCKIGALCYIAHGVKMNAHVLMPNCASISGYTIIGERVLIGPGATITNVTKIDDDARVTIGSVVCGHVRGGITVSGNPAIPHERFLEQYHKSLIE